MEGRVRLLAGPYKGRFPESICVLVETPMGRRVLVDAGCVGSLPGDVDAIVYTHHHPDHIRGSHLLGGVLEWSPEAERAYTALRDLAKRFAPPIWRTWLDMANSLIGVYRVPSGDYYRPGEDLCIAGTCLKTAPAPGHLSTHTVIELPGGILHIGDIDLTSFGPWYGNPESDPAQFLADIELAASWEARTYITSHQPKAIPREDALTLLSDYASRLLDQARRMLREYSQAPAPLEPREMAGHGIIYPKLPRHYRNLYLWFEANMLEKLAALLDTLGCLKRVKGGYVARGSYCDALEKLEERVSGIAANL